MDIKEIKRKIRMLRKFKKDTRVGTEDRRIMNKRIRKLQKELDSIYNCKDPEKKNLIDKINARCPHTNDLRKFTKEQLQSHYDKLLTEEYYNKWIKVFGNKKY